MLFLIFEKAMSKKTVPGALRFGSMLFSKFEKAMFVFMKKVFHIGSLFLSSLISTTPLRCSSMNNQVCKVRPEIVNVNTNEPAFYRFSIKTSKCSGSCNNINDPYVKIFVPNVVKDLNVKVFQELMKQDIKNGMESVSVNVDQTQVFVIINKAGIMTNVDVNVKN